MRRFVLLGLLGAALLAGAASSNAPAVSTAGSAIVVDGRPYFPVFTWAACPQDVDGDLAIGITVFMEHGAGCGSEADFLAALGQRAYYVPSVGGGLEGDPRLLGYTQPDEPDSHGIGPTQLEDVPGRISFLTLTTGFIRALPRYADSAARDLYGAYRAKADMFGVAVYPLSHLCGVTALASIYEIQRDLVAFATGKPTFQWLEAGDLEGACGAPITPQAARAEAWLAVAGGARGLGWFTYGWPDGRAQSFAIADDVAASIAETDAQIQSLATVLLSPSVRMSASTRAEPVKLGARAHAGRIYVIAVNSYDLPVRWSATGLPGLGKQRVTVVGEGRTLVARAGRLADAFAPLGVHVYSFIPAR